MRLVCFSGKSQAGKTTSALHCIKTFGGTKIALADAVKEEVGAFINSMGVGYEHRHLYGSASDREESLVVSVAEWTKSDYRPRRVLNKYMTWLNELTLSISYRQLLQIWGTEYRRSEREDYWVNKGEERILTTEGLVYVDDIRFPDEVEMIKKLGGIVIRIERPGGSRINTPDHPSETSLDGYEGFDVTIINAGDVTDLGENVEKILRLVI